MYTAVQDTIVAIASAPGHAPCGIVRLSGMDAIAIAAQLFRTAQDHPLEELPAFAAYNGEIVLDDLRRLPATVYLFREPRSYTRQNLIELHTVGAPPVLDWIVERCLAAGARLAEPGEFTARAFLAGAMSLSAAEAVAATIQARSDQQLRAARRMSRGQLADRLHRWHDELAELLSLVVADIDFAEEPIDFISPRQLLQRLHALRAELQTIVTTGAAGERLDVLPYVLLLGPPNAGKSTLLNTLSGMDRAIASAVSGTTRDILTAPVRLGTREAVMLDAAGVGDEPDKIIAHGRQRAIDAASTVDLVCLVFDASQPVNRAEVTALAELAHAPTVIAANKIDLQHCRQADFESCRAGPVCMVSAITGQGIDHLRALLKEKLAAPHHPAEDTSITLSARQRTALAEALSALDRGIEAATDADSVLDTAELIALELREALDALAAVAGIVTTEDLLGRVFASFCIGK